MSNFSVPLGILPNSILTTFPDRSSMTLNPSYHRVHLGEFSFSRRTTLLRGELGVTRFGLGQIPLPDPENAEGIIKHIFDRAEGFLYTVADAAVSGSYDDVVDSTKTVTTDNSDWLSGITSGMESVLKVLKDGLSTLHVPYPYGFAIILLTVLVKAATFPLTKKQVESAMAMRSMAPQIKAIQERYSGDQEKIQLETARLYKLAGINPLAGCLPTLATIPIWIGLYRALSNVANEGLLTEGFFWIPSLAGPTTIAARQTGSGTSWLFPFVDGHPPLGWSDTLAYLVLPVLLVITQYISIQIMQPPQSNDPNLKNSQAITKFLPLMIGYFALSVPSGLSLYWFTNNILSTAQQIWLQKLGGAKNPVKKFNDDAALKELPKLQISPSDAALKEKRNKAGEKKTKAGEQLTSEGLRPGERFKKLKAEEARRRQQRQEEEERRKAKEAEAKALNTKLEKEANLDEIKAGSEADESSISRTSESLNGSSSAPELKDPINGSKVHNNGDSGRSNQHPYSTPEKEELGHIREDKQNVFTGKDTEEEL